MRSLKNPAIPFLALAALLGTDLGVQAADSSSYPLSASSLAPAQTTLPTFAQAPSSAPSPWSGLYIGGGLSVWGGKGVKGGVGGDAYLGYNKVLPNNLVIGVRAVSGYAPNLYGISHARGFDYAGADVKVGYDMGRLTPYVTAGVALAKPNFGPSSRYDASDSLNDLFNRGGGALQTMTRVGAGVDYAISDKLSVGVSFSAMQYNGGAASPVLP